MLELFPQQAASRDILCAALRRHGAALDSSATGTGKCYARGTKVLLFDGSIKRVEDLSAGDVLMGPDSTGRTITSTCSGTGPMFMVKPTKKSVDPKVVNGDHLLVMVLSGTRPHQLPDGRLINCGELFTASVNDYLTFNNSLRHVTKLVQTGVDFSPQEKPLPIPPYLLGVWLGDGSAHGSQITKPGILEVIKPECLSSGWTPTRSNNTAGKCESVYIKGGMRTTLIKHGLHLNKHIPKEYLTASREDRRKLLAGLLDTDGHSERTSSSWEFSNTNKRIIDGAIFLCRSLGYSVSCTKRITGCKHKGNLVKCTNWRLHISPTEILPTRIKEARPRKQVKNPLRTGFSIAPVGKGTYYGFTLDGPDRMHLLADFSIGHNTLKAAEVARSLGLTAFVVCPKAVIPSWKACFAEQGLPFVEVLNYEKLRTGNTPWLKKDGRMFRWELPPSTILVVDEAHRVKSRKSQNAKMLVAATNQGIPRLMLSATAAEDPTELYAIGHALGLHKLTDYYRWAMKQGCSMNPWNQLVFPLKSRPKLAELHAAIYPEHGHKVSRADMGDLFSVTSVVTDPLDFGDDGEIARVYAEMDAELAELSKAVSSDKGASALTAQLRARQQIELMKVPALAEMVSDDVGEGKSVAVFLNFRASMDALAQRLPQDKVFVRGDQGAEEREESIAAFREDRVHVIVCQVSAGGVGVSLHDVRGERPRTSYVSPSFNAKDIVQCLGRIDRAGAKSDTVQRVLVAAGTIEEEVARSLKKKLGNMEILHKDLDNMSSSYNIASMSRENVPLAPDQTTTAGVGQGEPVPTEGGHLPAHAKHGPSSLKYKEVCPGWASREGTNRAAETGTRVHEAVEKEDPSILRDDWDRMLYERCLEAFGHIVRRHKFGKPDTDLKEIRLDIELNDGLSTFGTADRLLVKGKEAVMIDWKTGRGEIDDASVNTQAQAYTLGVFQKFPDVERVHFWFVIPQRDEASFHTYGREDTPDMALRLSTIVRRAEAAEADMDNAPLNPHSGVCDWCSRQHKCRAVAGKVLEIARKYGTDGLPVPDKVHGSETDDPETMAKLLKLVPVVEAWVAGVRNRAKQMVFEDCVEIPGFEPKEKSGGKFVATALAAWEAVKDVMPLDDFLSSVGSVPFNDIASHVYDNAPKGQKTKAKNALESRLLDLGVLESNPPVRYLQQKR